MEDAYTEEQMAKKLGITVNALRMRRSMRKMHPPFVKLSRTMIIYPKKLFEEWLEKRAQYALDKAS